MQIIKKYTVHYHVTFLFNPCFCKNMCFINGGGLVFLARWTVFQEVNIRFIIIIIIIISIIIIIALTVYTDMFGVLPQSISATFAQQLLRTGWQLSLMPVSCARSFSMESRSLLNLAVLHFSLVHKLFKT